jgi:hypothetical protein
MGLLTFSMIVTPDGWVDHEEGIADDGGDEDAPPDMREWAIKLEAKPKYVVSSTRTHFPWTDSHHIAGDLRTGVYQSGLLNTRRLELVSANPLRSGAVAMHYRRER